MSVVHKCESKNTGVNLKHMSVNEMPDKHTHKCLLSVALSLTCFCVQITNTLTR